MDNLIDCCTGNAMPHTAYREFTECAAFGSMVKPLKMKGGIQ